MQVGAASAVRFVTGEAAGAPLRQQTPSSSAAAGWAAQPVSAGSVDNGLCLSRGVFLHNQNPDDESRDRLAASLLRGKDNRWAFNGLECLVRWKC